MDASSTAVTTFPCAAEADADADAERRLRDLERILVVVAHPDDESFGLGAVLDRFTAIGGEHAVLCFTHGESSTLHAGDDGEAAARGLGEIRAGELAAAGEVLRIGRTELLDYPDGELDRTGIGELAGQVRRIALETRPTHVLVFDIDGVTGHPDHVHATRAAMAAAHDLDLPVLAWTLPGHVAAELNHAFGTRFAGRAPGEPVLTVNVDRTLQRRAIECHRSQSTDNPVLYRRLELLGDTEHLLFLRRKGDPAHT